MRDRENQKSRSVLEVPVILFFLLIWPSFLRAETPKFYCFFDRNLDFICRRGVSLGGEAMRIVKQDQFSIFLAPPNLDLATDKYKFLILRLKSDTDYPMFRINFLEKKTGAWPIDDLSFYFRKNNKFNDYYFDLSKSNVWRGTVNEMAFIATPNLEVEGFRLVGDSSSVFLRTIWQEFWSIQPERFFWINFLPAITVNGVPILYFLFVFILFIIGGLLLLQIRDKNLKKNQPIIILAVFLIFWLVLGVRMIYENITRLQNDSFLNNLSVDKKREVLVNQLFTTSSAGPDLYGYLDFVKEKVPLRANVFLSIREGDPRNILMSYWLVERYQIVDKPDNADYVLVYNAPESNFSGFSIYATLDTNRFIYKRN